MEKTNKRVRFDIITFAVTAISFIATVLVYRGLPEMIPYHWSASGEVKAVGKWIAFVAALIPVFIYYVAKMRLKKNQTEATCFLTAMAFVALFWVLVFIAMR